MLNALHRQLANRIMIHVRSTGMEAGCHLTEASLQGLLGTSRAPIRAAMDHLARAGVLEKRPHRGFFLRDPDAFSPAETDEADDERIYLKIAEDRLTGQLGQTVTEPDLMRRYAVARPQLRRVLARITREGWIERREGRGHAFAMLIDSGEAYRESYELRHLIEPAGLLAETFTLDWGALERLQAQQEFVRDGGWMSLSQIELFETNSRFHETLAAMSGNRFLASMVERQNQLRRLVEYRLVLNREQVRIQNREHLAILERLHEGDTEAASNLLGQHILQARSRKARADVFTP